MPRRDPEALRPGRVPVLVDRDDRRRQLVPPLDTARRVDREDAGGPVPVEGRAVAAEALRRDVALTRERLPRYRLEGLVEHEGVGAELADLETRDDAVALDRLRAAEGVRQIGLDARSRGDRAPAVDVAGRGGRGPGSETGQGEGENKAGFT